MKALESRRVILHCSATTPSQDVDVEWCRRIHVDERGWSDVGYHYFIKRDGTVQFGRPLNKAGAHTKGHNNSIGICYAGGLSPDHKPSDTMTSEQELAFLDLWHCLNRVFGPLSLHGHNEYANKACPSFVVKSKYSFLNHTP